MSEKAQPADRQSATTSEPPDARLLDYLMIARMDVLEAMVGLLLEAFGKHIETGDTLGELRTRVIDHVARDQPGPGVDAELLSTLHAMRIDQVFGAAQVAHDAMSGDAPTGRTH